MTDRDITDDDLASFSPAAPNAMLGSCSECDRFFRDGHHAWCSRGQPAPEPAAAMRKCSKCSVTKPATLDNFRPRCRDDGGGVNGLRSQCRSCMTRSDSYRDKMRRGADREHGRRTATSRPIIGEREHVKGPKPPDCCGGMPWRVKGDTCAGCGLAAGVEAKGELMLRRHYERVT